MARSSVHVHDARRSTAWARWRSSRQLHASVDFGHDHQALKHNAAGIFSGECLRLGNSVVLSERKIDGRSPIRLKGIEKGPDAAAHGRTVEDRANLLYGR